MLRTRRRGRSRNADETPHQHRSPTRARSVLDRYSKNFNYRAVTQFGEGADEEEEEEDEEWKYLRRGRNSDFESRLKEEELPMPLSLSLYCASICVQLSLFLA